MRHIKQWSSFIAISFAGMMAPLYAQNNVMVCYGKFNPDKVKGFKYVIVESAHFQSFDIQLLKERNEKVIGYISLGEVNPYRSYYDQIKDRTLGKNELWDSYYLNLSDSITVEVLMELVHSMVKKGFDGLFLDTVDAFGQWGPLKKDSMAYVNFIREVKNSYPQLYLMQNAGIDLLPLTANDIDGVALESVVTNYNFELDTYRARKVKTKTQRLSLLDEASKNYDLDIVLIEYAKGKKMREKVKKELDKLSWDYFIGTIELQDLPSDIR